MKFQLVQLSSASKTKSSSATYNDHLAELKESGEFLEIISEFGFTEEEVPPAELTADELCEGDIEALNEKYLN